MSADAIRALTERANVGAPVGEIDRELSRLLPDAARDADEAAVDVALREMGRLRGYGGIVAAAARTVARLRKEARKVKRSDPGGVDGAPEGFCIASDMGGDEMIAGAWAQLQPREGENPPLYRQPGRLVQVMNDGEMVTVDGDGLRALLAHRCAWHKWVTAPDGGGGWKRIAFPPQDLTSAMSSAAMVAVADLPGLDAVVRAPYVAADGEVVTRPGYTTHDRTLLLPHALDVRRMPLAQAVEVLRDWLADFPFIDEAGFTHAVGVALTPLVRRMINGPVPPVLIEAPKPRTGKTLLAQALCTPAMGWPGLQNWPTQPEEQEKTVFASVLKAHAATILDNIKGRVDSPSLEGVTTAYPTWRGRPLGTSEEREVPHLTQWVLTSNNGQFPEDMIGRLVTIRLDRKVERPDLVDTSKFRHPRIKDFTEANRGRILSALLSLVKAWTQAGRPAPSCPAKGSFEAWREVVGGILQYAGLDGFLAGASASRAEMDEWRALVAMWAAAHGTARIRLGKLIEICDEKDLVQNDLGGGGDHARLIRLGAAVKARTDQVFDVDRGLVLEAMGEPGEAPDATLDRCRYAGELGGARPPLIGMWRIAVPRTIAGAKMYYLERVE